MALRDSRAVRHVPWPSLQGRPAETRQAARAASVQDPSWGWRGGSQAPEADTPQGFPGIEAETLALLTLSL